MKIVFTKKSQKHKKHEKTHTTHHYSNRQRNNPLPDIALTQIHHNMNYQLWAEQAKTNLSKLRDNELRQLASGNDVDAAKLANEILLERMNRQAEQKVRQ